MYSVPFENIHLFFFKELCVSIVDHIHCTKNLTIAFYKHAGLLFKILLKHTVFNVHLIGDLNKFNVKFDINLKFTYKRQ